MCVCVCVCALLIAAANIPSGASPCVFLAASQLMWFGCSAACLRSVLLLLITESLARSDARLAACLARLGSAAANQKQTSAGDGGGCLDLHTCGNVWSRLPAGGAVERRTSITTRRVRQLDSLL